jgi:hypothetical protein
LKTALRNIQPPVVVRRIAPPAPTAVPMSNELAKVGKVAANKELLD